jgi:hypothetical protein
LLDLLDQLTPKIQELTHALEEEVENRAVTRRLMTRRRLGHISKQGNVLLRFFLVEAAQVTVRSQPQWRSKFSHLARRGRKIAKGRWPAAGGASVLDVAAGLGLRPVQKALFARGRARKSRWCAVITDVIWASRSLG